MRHHGRVEMNQTKKRIAILQPTIIPGGGTEAVTAWTIEALKAQYSVTLLSFSKVDSNSLNNFYGTQLKPDEYVVIRPYLFPFLRWTNRFAVLKDHLMMRYCKSVTADFDLFFGVGGGMDYGRRGIQYGAYAPASTVMKVLSKNIKIPAWYYLLKKSVMLMCESLSNFSAESLKSNITLAASEWTGQRMAEMYPNLEYKVLYPPVNGPITRTPWGDREEGFLCIARIVPGKMIDQAIEILKRVREKGFPVSIHIVGRPDNPSYFNHIQELQRKNSSWVFIHGILPKDELFSLMDRHKYGINAAMDEPFGIAVAEMVGAGAIVFVSDRGGHTEIVESPKLIYRDVDDAVNKIIEVLEKESMQKDLLGTLDGQREMFSTQAFCNGIRNVVDNFFSPRNDAMDSTTQQKG